MNDTTFYLEKNNFIVDEVFVTGQIKPTILSDVIQKSIIISKKDIEMQAANNLKDLLEKQLNMSVTVDNILGSSVSIQGISGQNVKILIDGVPVIGRLNGNIDLTQINLNNIERVEIIEGPLSVDYGTDALAGTINLITDKQLNDGFSSTIIYIMKQSVSIILILHLILRKVMLLILILEGNILMGGQKMMNLIYFSITISRYKRS